MFYQLLSLQLLWASRRLFFDSFGCILLLHFLPIDLVYLHFGNPLQPINSPYRPNCFINRSDIPDNTNNFICWFTIILSTFRIRHALWRGFPNEISGSPHSSQIVLRTVAPMGIEYVDLQSGYPEQPTNVFPLGESIRINFRPHLHFPTITAFSV